MSEIKQYIELYESNRAMIARHSSPQMNHLREEALETLRREGLPRFGSEHYTQTNLQEWFSKEYGINLSRLEMPVTPSDSFHCDVPNLNTIQCFMLNDRFYCPEKFASQLPEGVVLTSLKEAEERFPELVRDYYGKVADPSKEGVVAMNTLFAQEGLFLYIPDGKIVEKPIQLVNILQSQIDLMVFRRLLVIVGRGAQAKLLLCDHALGENAYLASQVTEIVAMENSHFDFYEMEENTLQTHRLSSTHLVQERSSSVLVNGITLYNGQSRNNYYAELKGEGAELLMSGMSITDEDQLTDNYTRISHLASHCTSKELFKYVLNDRSKGVFEGMIYVAPHAQKTAAFQTNRNLLATADARMYTKPQLEIYADDVKCSHGATVGQLDEDALFYLRARGISEKEARMMLSLAFTHDVIENLRLDSLKDRLRMLVEKRFRGELAKCGSCGTRC